MKKMGSQAIEDSCFFFHSPAHWCSRGSDEGLDPVLLCQPPWAACARWIWSFHPALTPLIVFICPVFILKCAFWLQLSAKTMYKPLLRWCLEGFCSLLLPHFYSLVWSSSTLPLGTEELPAGPGPKWPNPGAQGTQFKEAPAFRFEQVQRWHLQKPESECLLKSCTCPAVTTFYFLLQTQKVASVDPAGGDSNSRSPNYS